MTLPISSGEILQRTAKRIWRDVGRDPDTCPRVSFDNLKELDPSIFDAFYDEAITPIELLFMNRLNEIRRQARTIKAQPQHADEPEHAALETTVDQLLKEKQRLETAHIELVGALTHVKQRKLIERSVSVFYHAGKLAQKYTQELTPPLRILVQMWIDANPPSVDIEKRPRQILPTALRCAHNTETQQELPLGLFADQGTEQQLILPGIIRDNSSIVPAFPLDVYEASEGKPPERGGKGAPLAQRIWVNALLALPLAKREQDGSWRLITTLRDIKDWAYPQSWNRTHCLPRIQTALKDVHNMRVYWEHRLWNIVQVFAIPASNIKLDDPLPLLVRLPDGMRGEGAMINVTILRLLGVESAPQFRAWIKLAYIWDDAKQKNGGHRIYPKRPNVLRNNRGQPTDAKGNVLPKRNWNHNRAVWTGELEDNPAAARVPVLNDDDLIHLFFDNKSVSEERWRGRLLTAKKELEAMVKKGYVVIQELPEGIRILEPRSPEPQNFT